MKSDRRVRPLRPDGPLFDQDGIAVYHRDASDVLRQLPGDVVDLMLTDPPYSPRTHAGACTGDLATGSYIRATGRSRWPTWRPCGASSGASGRGGWSNAG